jgi:hypothetical protein
MQRVSLCAASGRFSGQDGNRAGRMARHADAPISTMRKPELEEALTRESA